MLFTKFKVHYAIQLENRIISAKQIEIFWELDRT